MRPTGRRPSLDRLRRRIGFDRNDLRRSVDRGQWMLGIALLMLFLSLAPPLCLRAGRAAYGSGVDAERSEAATRHRVEATVVKVDHRRSGRALTVTWRDPDGTARTGSFTAFRGGTVGEHRAVWAGPSGVTDEPPQRHARTIADALTAVLGAAAALGAPLLGVYLLVRYRCDRRRYRAWAAEWAQWDTRRIP
ncbi:MULTISPECIES: hypothetical protein [Actinomadura]|uniref:Uncharacterized protein n=1 Tax=Actinomadura litoris TaxID=2678616 RepID=A0A7K1L5J8_9ACTN|nr:MULTISPECIES: hypothetical protein [Actinomadura]MBT2212693.1 hypothetical protein [Actinomadura sp. NEAU-AAG7]MUN39669.1 hypothetical protein [Actinomadura litoris]